MKACYTLLLGYNVKRVVNNEGGEGGEGREGGEGGEGGE